MISDGLCPQCWFYHAQKFADLDPQHRCERQPKRKQDEFPAYFCRDYVLDRSFHKDDGDGM